MIKVRGLSLTYKLSFNRIVKLRFESSLKILALQSGSNAPNYWHTGAILTTQIHTTWNTTSENTCAQRTVFREQLCTIIEALEYISKNSYRNLTIEVITKQLPVEVPCGVSTSKLSICVWDRIFFDCFVKQWKREDEVLHKTSRSYICEGVFKASSSHRGELTGDPLD